MTSAPGLVATIVLCAMLAEPACAQSLDDWIGGQEFSEYSLVDSREINKNYFVVFRSESEIIVASRKLVEVEGVGGHRVQFHIETKDGIDLTSNGACVGRQIEANVERCGDQYCDIDVVAYEVPEQYQTELLYRLRWQWITADVTDVYEMRAYILEYLEANTLPLILKGSLRW